MQSVSDNSAYIEQNKFDYSSASDNSAKKKVYLNVSDTAAYIGQNKFDYVSPFERLWKRCDKESYTNIITECQNKVIKQKSQIVILQETQKQLLLEFETKKITKRQYTIRYNKLQKQINDHEENSKKVEQRVDDISLSHRQKLEKAIGTEIVDKLASNTLSTSFKQVDFNQTIENSGFTKDQKEILYKTGTSFINTTHGTLYENDAIKMYEEKTGVSLDTSQELFKKTFKIDDEYEWIICGKIDGIYKDTESNTTNNNYIVEVKNRTKAFFANVRDYEKTQIHLYMWMTGYNNAKLVEKKGNNIRTTNIPLCNDYLCLIFNKLEVFIDIFKQFLSNDHSKIEYISKTQNEKKMFIENLYLHKVNEI